MHTHTRTRPCPRAYRFDESSVARPSSTEARLLTAPSSTFHHLPSPSSTASGLLYMAHTWHIHGNASVVAFAPSIARTTSTALATADTDAHVDEVVRLVCSLTHACMHTGAASRVPRTHRCHTNMHMCNSMHMHDNMHTVITWPLHGHACMHVCIGASSPPRGDRISPRGRHAVDPLHHAMGDAAEVRYIPYTACHACTHAHMPSTPSCTTPWATPPRLVRYHRAHNTPCHTTKMVA